MIKSWSLSHILNRARDIGPGRLFREIRSPAGNKTSLRDAVAEGFGGCRAASSGLRRTLFSHRGSHGSGRGYHPDPRKVKQRRFSGLHQNPGFSARSDHQSAGTSVVM